MPYTLLLADDSVTIQRVIELTFADEDVTVVAVSDGDQAIARLESSPPDIVLADIGMPGKNGYEVAQYIRNSPKLSHIPVVLLTGAFEPVDQARANEAGCDGVLAKPFEPQLVIGRVKELLARPRRPAAAPPPDVVPPFAGTGDFSLPPLPAADAAHGDAIPESMWSAPQPDPRPAAPFVDPPFSDAPIGASATGPVPQTELNDYFDRLDAAFSTLSSSPAPPAPPLAQPAPAPAPAVTEIDWFQRTADATGASAEPWDLPAPAADVEIGDRAIGDLPMSHAAPQSAETSWAPPPAGEPVTKIEAFDAGGGQDDWEQPPPAFAAPPPRAATYSPPAPALAVPLPNPPPLPGLADAFAALLAAEQGHTSSADTLWPAAPPAAAGVNDAIVEDVVRRVLERLSDTVVRAAVADVVSQVAERLILEEIARIRASIQ